MYHFIKIKRFGTISCWYFVPKTEEEILEHWNKYISPIIKDGIRDTFNTHFKKLMKHPSNQYAVYLELLAKVHNQGKVNMGIFEEGRNEMVKVIEQRISCFRKHNKTLLTCSMLESFKMDDDVIVEEKDMETLTFPDEAEYNIDDVRFLQWPGGTHWYAKIGKFDICDDMGDYKWNCKGDAIEAAKWWVKNNRL
jgi:hypothetical protein